MLQVTGPFSLPAFAVDVEEQALSGRLLFVV